MMSEMGIFRQPHRRRALGYEVMLILKRLTIWLVETFLQAILLALALIGLFGYDRHAFGKSFGFYVTGILLLSFTTGYLLTTAVARGAWKNQSWWSY
jgi:hypothetical protein